MMMSVLAFEEELDLVPHRTVMREETVNYCVRSGPGLYLDVTAGWGGHSEAVLEKNPDARLIAFDRDPSAVAAASETLARFGSRARVVHLSFSELRQWLADENVGPIAGLIADLGVSSPQIDSAERGMSFRAEGPLDMRMDPTRGETALELIQRVTQDELADIIFQFGDERRSRGIARRIKQALAEQKLQTTLDLRRAVIQAVGPRRVGGIDPATRTFQGLRIAVNEELKQIQDLLELTSEILEPGAVAAVISFHSLEDRLAKRAFAKRDVWERLNKKPLMAGAVEHEANPRSRSAKLRAARRLVDEG